ncbi:MAG: YesL family protein [Eubacterium sp.]|nr:YesL family protein [Eubacterium sp.]
MSEFFNPDNSIMRFITKIANSVYLNILWLVCSLPVVTIGASTTSLFYVTLKMAKNEEGNITAAFFRSFRDNFKQATKIWLILLAAGIVFALDGYVFYHMRFENMLWTIGTSIFLVALAAYAIILMYIFPLLARFDNTTFAMFKNSLFIGMRFFLCTVLMAVIYFVMLFVVINIFTPAVIFGEGLCALLCSCLLSNILLMCQKQDEKTDTQKAAADLPHL